MNSLSLSLCTSRSADFCDLSGRGDEALAGIPFKESTGCGLSSFVWCFSFGVSSLSRSEAATLLEMNLSLLALNREAREWILCAAIVRRRAGGRGECAGLAAGRKPRGTCKRELHARFSHACMRMRSVHPSFKRIYQKAESCDSQFP